MEHDFILACGDSFTEGCQDIIGNGVDGTWPGMVANHFGVPFANLGAGGSSNTLISLQPVNTPHGDSIINWHGLEGAKNPLIIFAFTVMDRWTYFHPHEGRMASHFSVDPKFMSREYGNHWTDEQKHIPIQIYDERMHSLRTTTGTSYMVENYIWATMQAIQLAMQYEKLIPGAKVLWGFIHERSGANSFGKNIFEIVDARGNVEVDGVDWQYQNSCFNKWFDWKPIQRAYFDCTQSKEERDDTLYRDYIISIKDTHPNSKGIKLFADIFIEGLNGI